MDLEKRSFPVLSQHDVNAQAVTAVQALLEGRVTGQPSLPSVVNVNIGLPVGEQYSRSRDEAVQHKTMRVTAKSQAHVLPLIVGFGAAVVDFLWIPTGAPPFAVGVFNAATVVIAHLGYKA